MDTMAGMPATGDHTSDTMAVYAMGSGTGVQDSMVAGGKEAASCITVLYGM